MRRGPAEDRHSVLAARFAIGTITLNTSGGSGIVSSLQLHLLNSDPQVHMLLLLLHLAVLLAYSSAAFVLEFHIARAVGGPAEPPPGTTIRPKLTFVNV